MLTALIDRLRRRKLAQWAVAYLAGAWLLLQVLALLAQPFAWPDLVLRAATVALGIGLFAVLVLAWYHGEQGAQRVSGVELLMLAGILVVAGAAVAFVGRGREALPAAVAGPERTVEQGSIAVLPFADLSAARDQEYFADGLAEELLNVLAQFPELRVASRTSAFSYKGQEVRVDSIARALHVAYVLEGSVRKAGDRVRITAQLVDAASGYHRWSEHYDRELKDVFAVQDEISRAIVSELRLRLSAEREPGVRARTETADPEAHTLLLRGIAARATDEPEPLRQSVGLLREAIQRDPGYARAYAELATSLWRAGYMRSLPYPATYEEARRQARQALALDSTLADPYAVLGRVAEYRDWDWAGAERFYRTALRYNPNHAAAHAALSMLLIRGGQPEAGAAEAERAASVDPLSITTINNSGNVYLYAGRYEDAARCYRDGLALQPHSLVLLVNLAQAYSLMNRHEDALRAIAEVDTLAAGLDWVPGFIGVIQARAGRRPEAERALRQLRASPGVSPYMPAMVYATLGQADSAITLLERAVASRDDFAPDLALEPAFAGLRSDPRMQRLLRTVRNLR